MRCIRQIRLLEPELNEEEAADVAQQRFSFERTVAMPPEKAVAFVVSELAGRTPRLNAVPSLGCRLKPNVRDRPQRFKLSGVFDLQLERRRRLPHCSIWSALLAAQLGRASKSHRA
jgi:hypothetical protein